MGAVVDWLVDWLDRTLQHWERKLIERMKGK